LLVGAVGENLKRFLIRLQAEKWRNLEVLSVVEESEEMLTGKAAG